MNPIKKTKYSPGYFDELERNFMRIHNIAMGYEPRDINSNEPDIIVQYQVTYIAHFRTGSVFNDKLSLIASKSLALTVSATSVLPIGNVSIWTWIILRRYSQTKPNMN